MNLDAGAVHTLITSLGHDLCWHHPELWGLLPDGAAAMPKVPDWPRFLEGCIRYRASLDRQLPEAPRTQERPPR